MGQTRLLTNTFFDRLFESDLMPQGLPQMQLLIWGLVFAGGPTLGLPMLLVKKYTGLYNSGGDLPLAITTDRVILFTLSMLAMGFVGLLIWDGIFPDRRDARILGVLPVRTRTLVAARLIALGRVLLLFAAAICVPQAVLFGLLAGSYGDPAGLIRGVAAHLVTAAAACILVFSTLMALQCLLLTVLGRRAAQRASVVLQMVFAVGLIQLLFFLPQIGALLRDREQMLEWAPGGAGLLPGVWFLGLYEWLGGFADDSAVTLARVAAGLTVISLILSMLLYAACYRPLSRLALEGVPPKRRHLRGRVRSSGAAATEADAIRAAVREFVLRTLLRTRQHRMILALYAGIALALVLSSLLAVVMRRGGAELWSPSIPLLSIPLVFQFLPLVGIRMVAAIPSEPKANWTFRSAEPADRAHAIDGVRDAMSHAVLIPTVILAFVEGSLFWGIVAGACHALFCWAIGILLVEILLWSLVKIPFTCTYLPGRARMRTLWPFYFTAFTTYCYTLAGIERLLLRAPFRMIVVCAVLLVAGWIALLARHRALATATELRFDEEDPSALFGGFRLSEGLAATARTHAD